MHTAVIVPHKPANRCNDRLQLEQRQQAERQRLESELRQRQEAERQRLKIEAQKRDKELEEKLRNEKLIQDLKDKVEQDTRESLEKLELRFSKISARSKNPQEIEQVVEVKEQVEPEQPKFTIDFMIEAFSHLREQYPHGQKCKISKVIDNFLTKAIQDSPDNQPELDRMIQRITGYGQREKTEMIPLTLVIDQLKWARDNPPRKTIIYTTQPIEIDHSDSEDENLEDENDFIDELNRAVVHKHQSSKSTQPRQDYGMSM